MKRSKGSSSATGSAGSPDGLLPFDWPDGPPTAPAGPRACPASPTPVPAGGRQKRTNGISGLRCSGSSASKDLQRCLVNRLRQLSDTDGSIEYSLTWKERLTPALRRYSLLAPSARRTGGTGCSGPLEGWPTPTGPAPHDSQNSVGRPNPKRLQQTGYGLELKEAAWLAALGTVIQPGQAALAGWASPTAHEKARSEEFREGRELNPREALLAPWASPTAKNAPYTYGQGDPEKRYEQLAGQARLAGWPTPDTARQEALETWQARLERMRLRHPEKGGMGSTGPLHIAAQLTPGPTSTSSPAPTASSAASRGSLNVFFSAWLMGFPVQWVMCGIMASLKSKRR